MSWFELRQGDVVHDGGGDVGVLLESVMAAVRTDRELGTTGTSRELELGRYQLVRIDSPGADPVTIYQVVVSDEGLLLQ